MSIEAMTSVLSSKVGDSTSKLVLLAYANHARKDGTAAWPSKAGVADYAEVDPKTVQRHLRKLEKAGWIRRGDQRLVAHFRADRRPVVYDVAMTEATRLAWVDDQQRGDTLPPRATRGPVETDAQREDNLSPRDESHGGTSETSRGDTAVSPKPSRTVHTPPTPRQRGDRVGPTPSPTSRLDEPASIDCPRHQGKKAPGCRGCGTTPRQVEAARQRAAKQAAREAEQARVRAERAEAERIRAQGPSPSTLTQLADLRTRLKTTTPPATTRKASTR